MQPCSALNQRNNQPFLQDSLTYVFFPKIPVLPFITNSIQSIEIRNHTIGSWGEESLPEANEGKAGNKPVPNTAPRKCLLGQHEQHLLLLPLFLSKSCTLFFDIFGALHVSEEIALLNIFKVKSSVFLVEVIAGVRLMVGLGENYCVYCVTECR